MKINRQAEKRLPLRRQQSILLSHKRKEISPFRLLKIQVDDEYFPERERDGKKEYIYIVFPHRPFRQRRGNLSGGRPKEMRLASRLSLSPRRPEPEFISDSDFLLPGC